MPWGRLTLIDGLDFQLHMSCSSNFMCSTEHYVYSKTPDVQTNYSHVLVPNSATEAQVIHPVYKISTHNYNACLLKTWIKLHSCIENAKNGILQTGALAASRLRIEEQKTVWSALSSKTCHSICNFQTGLWWHGSYKNTFLYLNLYLQLTSHVHEHCFGLSG